MGRMTKIRKILSVVMVVLLVLQMMPTPSAYAMGTDALNGLVVGSTDMHAHSTEEGSDAEEVPVLEESSAAEKTSEPTETTDPEKVPVLEESSAAEKTSEPTETTDPEKVPVLEESSAVEKTSEPTETTDPEKVPVLEESSAVEETSEPTETTDPEKVPVLEESSAVEETSEPTKTTDSKENAVLEESSAVEETFESTETTGPEEVSVLEESSAVKEPLAPTEIPTEEKIVTAWRWVDVWKVIDFEINTATIPGVGENNPINFETLVEFLPAHITATIGGVEENLALVWASDSFSETSIGGKYEFIATLPEGYTLGEGVSALILTVDLGGAVVDATAPTYISKVAVAYGTNTASAAKNVLTGQGYTVVNFDLNNDAGGDYIYMGYKTTNDADQAITGFYVRSGQNPPNTMTRDNMTYYLVGSTYESGGDGIVDLNKGAGGDYLYLYVTRSKSRNAVTSVTASNVNPGGSVTQTSNVNAGTGDQDIRIFWYSFYGTSEISYYYLTDGSYIETEHDIVLKNHEEVFSDSNPVSPASVTRDGNTLTFAGWRSNYTGYTSDVTTPTSKWDEDTQYFAVYTAPVTLSYSANGGKSSIGEQQGTVRYVTNPAGTSPYSSRQNVSLTVTSASPTHTDKCKFLGWSTNSSATKADYTKNNTISLSTSVKLYAVWQDHSFNTNGFCTVCSKYQPATVSGTTVSIANPGQLLWFAGHVNGDTSMCGTYDKNVTNSYNGKLTANINMSGQTWNSIGTSSRQYTGTFNGQNYTISNLTTTAGGLFGRVGTNGKIQNVVLSSNCNIRQTIAGEYCGAIVNYCFGTVSGCTNNAPVHSIYIYSGGIVGRCENGTLTNCKNTGKVTNEFTNNYVDHEGYAGGIVGSTTSSTITNCSNTGEVICKGQYVGGIAGAIYAGGMISDSYNTGNVSSTYDYVGGITGRNRGTITKCYNTGRVTADDYAGGIAGYSEYAEESGWLGKISYCYSYAPSVKGRTFVGGIVAVNSGCTVTSCYSLEYLGIKAIYFGDGINVAVKSAAQFKSGEVAYLLNDSTNGGSRYYQAIDIGTAESYPHLTSNGNNTVYIGRLCGTYSNTNYGFTSVNTTHSIDSKGFCQRTSSTGVRCNAYETASVGSDGVVSIFNAGQLFWFAAHVNGDTTMCVSTNSKVNNTSSAVLTRNIVVNENLVSGTSVSTANAVYTWPSIGTTTREYTGTFNGQGYTISGLYGGDGLFYYTSGATVKNVGVLDSNLRNAGVIANMKNGTITSCWCSDSYITGTEKAGGVVGYAYNNVTISYCWNEATVYTSGSSSKAGGTGGVIGSLNGYGTGVVASVTYCYNKGSVTNGGTVEQEWTSAIGGVVGQWSMQSPNDTSGRKITISHCYNVGPINAGHSSLKQGSIVGGGYLYDGNYYVSDCYYDSGKSGVTTAVGSNGGGGSGKVFTNLVNMLTSQFTSGEVAFLLNNSTQGGSPYYQRIGSDAVPHFTSTGSNAVYAGRSVCVGEYDTFANSPVTIDNPHNFTNGNGFCVNTYANGTRCGAYQPATLANGVYQISNAGNLWWFAALVNGASPDGGTTTLTANVSANAKVTADIDMSTSAIPSGLGWTNIGTSASGKQYTGTFDGGNKTLAGLTTVTELSNAYGLFGVVGSGTVKNVRISSWNISAGANVGFISGQISGATIENCHISNCTANETEGYSVGGITGYGYGTIRDCSVTSTMLNGQGNVGGISGQHTGSNTVRLERCAVTDSTLYTSGAMGQTDWKFTNCGGLVGLVENKNVSIHDCYVKNNSLSTGKNEYGISNALLTGKLVGCSGAAFSIENCYAVNTSAPEKTAEITSFVGGFIDGDSAFTPTISNCYVLGTTGAEGAAETYLVKSAEQFAYGEVAWLLNGQTTQGAVFKQDLDIDNTPDVYPNFTGATVYGGYESCMSAALSYSNSPLITGDLTSLHKFVNGFCVNEHEGVICDAYEPAIYVRSSNKKDANDNTEDNTPYTVTYVGYGLDESYCGKFLITNPGQLYWFVAHVNGTTGEGTHVLTTWTEPDYDQEFSEYDDAVLINDLDINPGFTFGSDGSISYSGAAVASVTPRSWIPFGLDYESSTKAFQGTLDGNGHSIRGLYSKNENAYIAFIVNQDSCDIEDLVLENVYFQSSNANAAGFIFDGASATLTRCGITGTLKSSQFVGGLVNIPNGGFTATDCYAIINISAPLGGGGLCCKASSGSRFISCYTNLGTAVQTWWSGSSVEANLTNCYMLGDYTEGAAANLGTKTAEQFASGEVAWLLNKKQPATADADISTLSLIWYQDLESDDYPLFIGEVVYPMLNCMSVATGFTNDPNDTPTLLHSFKNGFCINEDANKNVCGKYERAILVTVTAGDTLDDATPYEAHYNELKLTADHAGYYAVGNPGQLYWVAEHINNTAKNADSLVSEYISSANHNSSYVLYEDIVVNAAVFDESGKVKGGLRSWVPMGRTGANYACTFDGNNKTVSGIYCKNPAEPRNSGFFNTISSGCTIKNLTIAGSYFYSPSSWAGGIVGGAYGGTVYNCACIDSYIEASAAYAGGITGMMSDSTAIEKCWSNAHVEASSFSGGITGELRAGNVKNCYFTGTVSGSSEYVSGIVGFADANYTNSVENCYFAGSIDLGVSTNVASDPIVVLAFGAATTVSNCYYLSDTGEEGDAATSMPKDAEQFASGEVTWLLNKNVASSGSVWRQDLTADVYPLFSGPVVYTINNCLGEPVGYTNDEKQQPVVHHYDKKGFCDNTDSQGKVCGAFQYAELNANNFYEIGNAGQLFWAAALVNGTLDETCNDTVTGQKLNANFLLVKDIDLENREWYPIGVYQDVAAPGVKDITAGFVGTFDGGGHTVSNFKTVGANSQGLVGYGGSPHAVVQNVGVINATVSGWNAGSVAAFNVNVIDCYAVDCSVTAVYSGTSTTSSSRGGAVAGSATNCATVNSFAYDCTVNVAGENGGKVCYVGGTPTNCYYANVTGNSTFENYSGEVKKSYDEFASGEVTWRLNEQKPGYEGDATALDSLVWHQDIDTEPTDPYPIFNAKVVYPMVDDENNPIGTYYNEYIVSVDIEYGAMIFNYAGVWDPDTHTYSTGEWMLDETDGDLVKVTNVGTVNVNIGIDITEGHKVENSGLADDGITVALANWKKNGSAITDPMGTAMLVHNDVLQAQVAVSGEPNEIFISQGQMIGQVTVSLSLPATD